LDVEGAELGALRGARRVLAEQRPVLLVEVYDIRTRPWRYRAREIVEFLHRDGYEWFRPKEDGTLESVRAGLDFYDANLVAIPEENVRRLIDSMGLF